MSAGAPDPVADLVREAEFGRWASSLFAPADVRPHLLALYAFDAELSRVRDLVSEPMPGEIRLQWWRDALENPQRADVLSNPIARALSAAAAFGKLPREALLGLVDARIDDLYDDAVPTLADLEARLGATFSAVLRLASLIAANGRDPGGAEVAGFGGVAQGIAYALRHTPRMAARGGALLPVERMAAHGVSRDELAAGFAGQGTTALAGELIAHARSRLTEARAAYAELDPVAAPAMLPLALVAPELDRLERRAVPGEPARWRTMLRLWRMSRRRPPF